LDSKAVGAIAQHLINASLIDKEGVETLRLAFSSHDVEIAGHNLRSLFLALEDFAVKWVRSMRSAVTP
jgi:hypothetical protein